MSFRGFLMSFWWASDELLMGFWWNFVDFLLFYYVSGYISDEFLMSFCWVSDEFSGVSDKFLLSLSGVMSFWWVFVIFDEFLMSFWCVSMSLWWVVVGRLLCYYVSGYISEFLMSFCWVSDEFSVVSDEFLISFCWVYLTWWVSDEFLMSFCWVSGVQIQHRFNKISTKFQQKSPKLNRISTEI